MDAHYCVSLVPLFHHLSQEDQAQINRLAQHRTYSKGQVVLSPGDDKLVILAQGALKVYLLSPNGKEQILRVLHAGDYEGEHQLFGLKNDSLYAETLEASIICSLTKNDFNQVLVQNPQLALRLFELSGQKLVQVQSQAQYLSMERVEERLAAYLVQVHRESASDLVHLPMKLKDLALYLGTSPETLSRKLKSLEDQGLIQRKGRRLKIMDAQGLEDI